MSIAFTTEDQLIVLRAVERGNTPILAAMLEDGHGDWIKFLDREIGKANDTHAGA